MANYYGNTRKWVNRTSHQQRSAWAKQAAQTRKEMYSQETRSEWAKKAAATRRENENKKMRYPTAEEINCMRSELAFDKVAGIVFIAGIGVPGLIMFIAFLCMMASVLIGFGK